MDNFSLWIAMDCHDDMELVRHLVVALSRRQSISLEAALSDLLERIALLQIELPIAFFVSSSPFGDLTPLANGIPTLRQVVGSSVDVAGPPFVHLTRTDWPDREKEAQFVAFFDKYGLPKPELEPHPRDSNGSFG